MRVLHVYKTYLPDTVGGVPKVIYDIAEGTAPSGVESDVLALSPQPSSEPLRIGTHTVHQAREDLHIASTGLSLSIFKRFSELAARADLIHYHFPWPVADLLYFAAARRKPSVVTYHSDIVKQKLILPFYAPLMHAFLGRADAIVATSPNYIETSPVLQRHKAKLSVIPIGIPEREAPLQADIDKWRSEVGQDFFLFVGALRYYKGLTYLVEAARLTGLPVIIAGAGTPERAGIADAPDNVRFVGEISDADKEALLSLCRAFVFPSHLRSEAFGIAMLEAIRAGKPAICCEIGSGMSYVNLDGETGLLVPPADPQAFASAMTTLSNDAALAAKMGGTARARYTSVFQRDAMAAAYLQLYKSVLDGRPASV